ncbi:cytidylyltransferase domain-containing protein [Salinibacter ruber]|uniref:Spore coat polysaccharide biosynthesis protein SpsF n=1 Tax=Salinibacter ruber TaxID=146919 RepID=A0A9X2UBG9_9BACT|nr:NTP transferase domain-containing protein [Salinibacter ruber]MCS3953303.1 spore coat polysaccharide biosynthesis protein SpsF [Salinibacter ruber]
MTVLLVLTARLDSSRLWGKSLLPYAGIPAIKLILQRTQHSDWGQLLAISEDSSSDPIADHARLWDADFIRGSHEDVLSRVLKAADAVEADTVVRATSDNPMLDARAVQSGIRAFHDTAKPAVCNLGLSGTDDPMGYFVDIASVSALRELHARDPEARLLEHVTLGLKEQRQCEPFRVLAGDQSEVSWTVDESEDYLRVSRMFVDIGPEGSAEDALNWTK